MAEDSDLDRTEQATPRRLEQAREEGQVARSQELSAFAVLAAAFGGLSFAGGHLLDGLLGILRSALAFDAQAAYHPATLLTLFYRQLIDAIVLAAPLFALTVVVALGAPLILGGWLFTARPLAPDWTRLNPLAGLRRILSTQGLVELGKALAKAVVIGSVAALTLWQHREALLALAGQPLEAGLGNLGCSIAVSLLIIIGAMSLIVMIDVPYQLWKHASRLRMARHEIRQEMRETEGDPQVKAAIRSQQREMARRRMMAEVPKADVVVTNPLHFAVALRYQGESMRAPRVVAKGAHLLAERIRNLATAHRVPVLESPPLARALYRHAEIGDEIPAALYTAVAEVLAYVYQLRHYRQHGGVAPQPLALVPVPAGLDPQGLPS